MLFSGLLERPDALDRAVSGIAPQTLLTHAAPLLVDPARAAAAAHLQAIGVPLWALMTVLQIGVLAWFWSSGSSARLRDALRARVRSEFCVRFLFGVILAGVDKLAAFVPQVLQFRLMHIMDLTATSIGEWSLHWVQGALVAMLIAGVIAAVILGLADRTHQWYLYTIVAVVGSTLLISYVYPFAIAPLTTRLQPLHASGALASDIARLRQQTGVAVPVLEERVAGQTHTGRQYVMGWGGSQRAVLSDTLIAGSTPAEVRFVVAREFAWVEANDGLHVALIEAAMLVLAAALAIFIADRIRFRRDDDPVSRLALLGALLGAVYLVGLPFYNGYLRNVRIAQDGAALALTRDPVAAIRREVRHADQSLVPICSNTLAGWYFDESPALGRRIAAIQGKTDPCGKLTPRSR